MTAVLVIGGTDSSGGAGLVQDGRVLDAFGCAARLVVTAVTAQGRGGVTAVQAMPRDIVLAQIAAVASLGPVAAIKIGLIPDMATGALLAEALPRLWPQAPIILDPVLSASAGGALRGGADFGALWSLAALVTPNLPEAAALLAAPEAPNRRAMTAHAKALRARGAKAVLLKGGHLLGESAADLLLTEGSGRWFSGPRLPGQRRGTGCALATAIAAGLAQGRDLPGAIVGARRWLRTTWPKAAVPAGLAA